MNKRKLTFICFIINPDFNSTTKSQENKVKKGQQMEHGCRWVMYFQTSEEKDEGAPRKARIGIINIQKWHVNNKIVIEIKIDCCYFWSFSLLLLLLLIGFLKSKIKTVVNIMLFVYSATFSFNYITVPKKVHYGFKEINYCSNQIFTYLMFKSQDYLIRA